MDIFGVGGRIPWKAFILLFTVFVFLLLKMLKNRSVFTHGISWKTRQSSDTHTHTHTDLWPWPTGHRWDSSRYHKFSDKWITGLVSYKHTKRQKRQNFSYSTHHVVTYRSKVLRCCVLLPSNYSTYNSIHVLTSLSFLITMLEVICPKRFE